MSDLPSNAPSPRLCHIAKWSDFDGYGFNLHADKSRPGQYIGKVDENSPADVAGLREGDRIIEVNGVNISNENHKQVVKRIKAVTNETKLLVIDSEGDRWYKDHNLVIRGDQPNIIVKTSSKQQQQKEQSTDSPAGSQKSASLKNEKINSNSSSAHDEDNKSVASSTSLQSEQSVQQQQSESREEDNVVESVNEPMNNMNIDDGESELLPPPPPPVEDKNGPEETLDPDLSTEYDNVRFEQEKNENGDGKKDHLEDNHSLSSHASHASSRSCEETAKADNDGTTGSVHDADDLERKSPMSTTPSPPPSLNPEGGSTGGKESPSLNNTGGLNLNMTAAEMRAHLASKKKFDPRKDSIDLKKKYEIIQNM